MDKPILLDDRRDQPPNFSRRLRVIGHFGAAEDESQEWPDLHAAICEARKAYQAEGVMPDWAAPSKD